jgi:hypothetical protein
MVGFCVKDQLELKDCRSVSMIDYRSPWGNGVWRSLESGCCGLKQACSKPRLFHIRSQSLPFVWQLGLLTVRL